MKKYILIFCFLFLVKFSPLLGAARIDNGNCLGSFSDIVEPLTPAVVNISTTQDIDNERQRIPMFPKSPFFEEFKQFFENLEPFLDKAPENKEVLSLGSGFIIDESGIIVTNNHVISHAKEITVTLSDNTQVKAKILGQDTKTDLAVLKITVDKKLPYVKFGNSDNAKVGDWVIAIGNPFGLGGSVSAGIISARSRDINIGTANAANDFIQTDAAINRGNSGGPLFNTNGQVVGINTAIYSPSGGNVGIGFAIPSNSAEPIIKILASGKKVIHGWLGVKVQFITKEIADSLNLKENYGALVAEVTKNSPADKAEVKAGDVIIEFNGTKIKQMQQLLPLVSRAEANKKVNIKIYRNGNIIDKIVTIGKLQNVDGGMEFEDKDDEKYYNNIGLKVKDLTDDIKKSYNIQNKVTSGVIVTKVDINSDATKKNIGKGDIITQINQTTIKNVKDFNKVLEQAKKDGKTHVMLLVDKRRNTGPLFISVKLK